MATGVVSWSETAATNATADANVNWAEGMAPSAVNNSARAEMASVAMYRDDNAGSLVTSGTSTAYTVTTNQTFASLTAMAGQSIRVRFHTANGASPTLNVDSLGAKTIAYGTGGTAIAAGTIGGNTIVDLVYSNSASVWVVVGWLSEFASGFTMLTTSATAPTGWTKSTAHDNKALRIVSGTPSTGGTATFTSVFTSRTIGQANLPNISLNTYTPGTISTNQSNVVVGNSFQDAELRSGSGAVAITKAGSSISSLSVTLPSYTPSLGGSGTAMEFGVAYVDLILITKD